MMSLLLFIRALFAEFIELCMETLCLCPSEGHKHGGPDVTKTSVSCLSLSFAVEMKRFTIELRHIKKNAGFS